MSRGATGDAGGRSPMASTAPSTAANTTPAPDRRGTTPSPGRTEPRHRPGPAALLVVLWLLLLPFTHHYVNPDGPAYAEVAARWADGSWASAINAYWGPLLSWLAAPLLVVGVPGILALRLVLLGGALAVLPAVRRLAHRAGASDGATEAVRLGLAPFLVYNALFGLYPDVLLAAALLWSLEFALRREGLADLRHPATAGVLSGVAYLARAYAVPVVLVVLPLVALLHRRGLPQPTWHAVRRWLGAAGGAFLLVVGAWSVVLSVSYGTPTFSTSAGFNAQLVAPGSAGNPYNVRGLYEPPDDEVVSAWIEPSQLPVPLRSGASSLDERPDGEGAGDGVTGAVRDRIERVVANARIVVGSLLRRGLPIVALVAVAVLALVRRRELPTPAFVAPLLLGAVAVGGLTLIIAIERYTWIAVLAAAPIAAVGLDRLLVGRRQRGLPVAAVVLVGVMFVTSVHGLLPRVGAMSEVTRVARTIGDEPVLPGRVATVDGWQETHRLCAVVGCQYLGRPESRDADAAAAELAAAGVDHLVVWDGDEGELPGLPEVTGERELTVFAVTDDGLQPTYRVGDLLVPIDG
jgi:hypothetical protein